MKPICSFLLFISFSQLLFSQDCCLKAVYDVAEDGKTILSKTVYNYDKTGKLTSWYDSSDYIVNYTPFYINDELLDYNEGSDGNIYFTHRHLYSGKKLTKVMHFNDLMVCEAITRYAYDSKGRVKSVTYLGTELMDTIVISDEIFYYENDNSKNPFSKLEILEYNADSILLEYDEKKNPFLPLGTALGTWEQNNLLSMDVVEANGVILPDVSLKFQYTYNKRDFPEIQIAKNGYGNFQFARKFVYECK